MLSSIPAKTPFETPEKSKFKNYSTDSEDYTSDDLSSSYES